MNFQLDKPDGLKQSLMSKAGYFVFLFVVLLNIAYHCFTEVGLNWHAVLSLSCDALLYLSSVYVTFCAMADTARRNARLTAAYQNSLCVCKSVTEKAKAHRSCLSDYVNVYLSDNLTERQKAYLEVAGISYRSYREKWRYMSKRQCKKAGFTRAERMAITHANRVKPQRITREGLLTFDDTPPKSNPLVSPGHMLARRYGASLLPSTVFALFSAQIVFLVAGSNDPKTVFAESLLRIGLLSWTALRGYTVGEKTILCDTVGYLSAKADFLEGFILWKESQAEKKQAEGENHEVSSFSTV